MNQKNKARSFIQLLSQIIKLSYEATNIKLEIENVAICQQGMKSFNQIKSKMQNLNMKEEDKHRMEETIGDIMNLFD